jgi:hypothetical protein
MYSILDLSLLLIPEQVLSNNRGTSIHHHNKDKAKGRGDHRTQDQYQQIWYLPLQPGWMGIKLGDHQRGEVGIHYHQEEGDGLLV